MRIRKELVEEIHKSPMDCNGEGEIRWSNVLKSLRLGSFSN